MTSHKKNIITELPNLSDKEELLLSRYYDGECGYLSTFLANRLIRNNKAAQEFLHNLKQHSQTLQSEASSNLTASPDLWARIDARITQEEKAAFYLGERRVAEQAPSWLDRLRASQVAMGGLSGAAIAMAALVFVYSPRDILTFSVPTTASSSSSVNQFQQIGFGNSEITPRSAAFTQVGNQALEVDWMRSKGSLSLIPGANGSSAVIWVRRRNAIPSQTRNHAALRPTPLGRAEPTATIAAQREWLDVAPRNSAK